MAGLLLGVWLLVVAWQVEEHHRVMEAAKTDLRSRSHEIAGTLSAVTRALQFRGAIFQDRLEPVLNELVNNRTNALVKSSGLISVGLLNTDGDPVVAVGDTNLFSHEILAGNELWSDELRHFRPARRRRDRESRRRDQSHRRPAAAPAQFHQRPAAAA